MISMKEAKTAQEMLDSWQELVGDGDIADVNEAFQVYAKKMPDIIKRFCHGPLVASNERAREVLGWTPLRSTLPEMIGSAWAWRRAHPDGYGD